MSKIDVLFLTPSAPRSIYQKLSDELSAIEPPIWASMLTNSIRAHGHSVALIDSEGEGYTIEEAVKKSGEVTPKLTVIVVYGQQPSASTQNMHAASLLCTQLKQTYPDRKVLMVGGHVSALPERTLKEEAADFVCQGEGPHTILGLLQTNMSETSELKKVPGLYYKEDGQICTSSVFSELIPQENLSTMLPGMSFDLLPMKNYRAHNWHCFGSINERKPYASVYTSLGCPYKCTFCCINAPFGKSSFRFWEPEFIVEQFEVLATKYNVRNIKIADEMFVLNKSHFLKLCELLVERKHNFNIWAYARVDTVKPEYLATLKAAGVNWLALGIESGSKHVRDGVTKGRFKEDDIRNIVKQIKEAGLYTIGNYIFGLPDDTYDTMQETLDLAVELNCEMANFYCAMAYPGSKLYPMALENGWRLPETWSGFSQHSVDCLPLPTEKLAAGEVISFRDEAFNAYFNNQKYQQLVLEKFGDETLQHIKDMMTIKLERKNALPLVVHPTIRG